MRNGDWRRAHKTDRYATRARSKLPARLDHVFPAALKQTPLVEFMRPTWRSRRSPGCCAGDARSATTSACPPPTKRWSSGPWSASCWAASRHHPAGNHGHPHPNENHALSTFLAQSGVDNLELLELRRAKTQAHESHHPPRHQIQERRQHQPLPSSTEPATLRARSDQNAYATSTRSSIGTPHPGTASSTRGSRHISILFATCSPYPTRICGGSSPGQGSNRC